MYSVVWECTILVGEMCNLIIDVLTIQAMEKLHQLDVFGSRLVVEYARASHASVVHEAKLDKYVSQTLLCLSP